MNANCTPKKHLSSGKTPSGFSLVELLIAMTLSVILLAGVVSIYANSKQTYNVQEGLSRLQENARFAMDRLNKEISSAGYMGCLPANIPVDPTDPLADNRITNTLTNQVPGTINDVARPVFGVDGGGVNIPDSITLIRARAQTGIPMTAPMLNENDNITLNSAHRDYPNLSQFDIVSLSDCSRSVTFMITNVPPVAPAAGVIQHLLAVVDPVSLQSNATTDLAWVFGAETKSQATLLPVRGNTYTIGNSVQGACTAATPGFCALLENGVELVEGVQNFQVLYGEDTLPAGALDTAVDFYRTANNVVNWDNVVSVRITLTVNEVERVQGSGNGLTNANTLRTYTNTIRIRSRGV